MKKISRYVLLKHRRKLLKSLILSIFVAFAVFAAFPVIQSVYCTANAVSARNF